MPTVTERIGPDASAIATMPVLLACGHVATMTSYDLLAWAGLALIVARIGRTGDCRWWLAGGVVAGLGAEDNHLTGVFAIAVLIAALADGARRMVVNPWFLAGAAIAVAFLVPDRGGHVYLCTGPRQPWGEMWPGCATTTEHHPCRGPWSRRLASAVTRYAVAR